MKKVIIVFFLIASQSIYAQFFTELGSGYAFSTKKAQTTFDNNNYIRICNIYSGVFYKGLIGYQYKNNLGLELNCAFKPKAKNILNYPQSINTFSSSSSYNHFWLFGPSFYDGSFVSIIPKISYNYKINHLSVSLGWGIGYFLLNYYCYTHDNQFYQSFSNGELTYRRIQKGQSLYQFTEEQYRMNISFKINYALNNAISIFMEINSNLHPYIFHYIGSKFIYFKYYDETYDVHDNPNTSITEIDVKNINLGHGFYDNFQVHNAADLSKLIYAQIGVRYTFGKKE
ncbi:MAG TPA: hypothetical protein PLP65_11180 [Bacteroidales bacterium]|nr:hypothetical protein [Bacteroidales bacterium]